MYIKKQQGIIQLCNPDLWWKYYLTKMWQSHWDASRLKECRMGAEIL